MGSSQRNRPCQLSLLVCLMWGCFFSVSYATVVPSSAPTPAWGFGRSKGGALTPVTDDPPNAGEKSDEKKMKKKVRRIKKKRKKRAKDVKDEEEIEKNETHLPSSSVTEATVNDETDTKEEPPAEPEERPESSARKTKKRRIKVCKKKEDRKRTDVQHVGIPARDSEEKGEEEIVSRKRKVRVKKRRRKDEHVPEPQVSGREKTAETKPIHRKKRKSKKRRHKKEAKDEVPVGVDAATECKESTVAIDIDATKEDIVEESMKGKRRKKHKSRKRRHKVDFGKPAGTEAISDAAHVEAEAQSPDLDKQTTEPAAVTVVKLDIEAEGEKAEKDIQEEIITVGKVEEIVQKAATEKEEADDDDKLQREATVTVDVDEVTQADALIVEDMMEEMTYEEPVEEKIPEQVELSTGVAEEHMFDEEESERVPSEHLEKAKQESARVESRVEVMGEDMVERLEQDAPIVEDMMEEMTYEEPVEEKIPEQVELSTGVAEEHMFDVEESDRVPSEHLKEAEQESARVESRVEVMGEDMVERLEQEVFKLDQEVDELEKEVVELEEEALKLEEEVEASVMEQLVKDEEEELEDKTESSEKSADEVIELEEEAVKLEEQVEVLTKATEQLEDEEEEFEATTEKSAREVAELEEEPVKLEEVVEVSTKATEQPEEEQSEEDEEEDEKEEESMPVAVEANLDQQADQPVPLASEVVRETTEVVLPAEQEMDAPKRATQETQQKDVAEASAAADEMQHEENIMPVETKRGRELDHSSATATTKEVNASEHVFETRSTSHHRSSDVEAEYTGSVPEDEKEETQEDASGVKEDMLVSSIEMEVAVAVDEQDEIGPSERESEEQTEDTAENAGETEADYRIPAEAVPSPSDAVEGSQIKTGVIDEEDTKSSKANVTVFDDVGIAIEDTEGETVSTEEPDGPAVEDTQASTISIDGDVAVLEGEVVEQKPTEVCVQVDDGSEKVVETDLRSLQVSQDDESDITVSVVTWNLAELSPSEEDASFIRRFRRSPKSAFTRGRKKRGRDDEGSDIVLISGQECENVKPRRAEGHRSREFRRLMIKMLGKKYVPLAIHSLGGVQFGLFCKRAILGEIEFVGVADVACGIGNMFHNKGSIGAFVQMKAREMKGEKKQEQDDAPRAKSLRMLFLTAHMAAHVKNTEARNMDFWRVVSELEAQAPPRFLTPKPAEPWEDDTESKSTGLHLMDSMDRIFLCGDLNYRVDLPREVAEYTVSEMCRQLEENESNPNKEAGHQAEQLRLELLRHDQLLKTISEGRAFPKFAEGKITFPPTFKFDKGTTDYDTSHKQRIPAWTDRVLFKPSGVRVLEYDSVADATHSDHRPVYATFKVSMLGKSLPDQGRKRRTRKRKNEGSKSRNSDSD